MNNSSLSSWRAFFQRVPREWELVALDGKKPLVKSWQSIQETRLSLIKKLEVGKATGIGLKTGICSGRILAVDCDGSSAKLALKRLLGTVPRTLAITSGRPGRMTLFFRADERLDYFGRRVIQASGDELLEFRYNGHQCVLPPSIHPGTGKAYQWVIDNALAHLPEPIYGVIGHDGRPKMMDYFLPCQAGEKLTSLEYQALTGILGGISAWTYEAWFRCAVALLHIPELSGEEAFKLWCIWSESCPQKYTEQAQVKLWQSLERRGFDGWAMLARLANDFEAVGEI